MRLDASPIAGPACTATAHADRPQHCMMSIRQWLFILAELLFGIAACMWDMPPLRRRRQRRCAAQRLQEARLALTAVIQPTHSLDHSRVQLL